MQQLLMLIEQERRKGEGHVINIIREYLQVIILKEIYGSKYGTALSFMGGTCLRLCYGLKRYSEDLDFALDSKIKNYSFAKLNEHIKNRLSERGIEVETSVKADKTAPSSLRGHSPKQSPVERSFVRFPLDLAGVGERKGQKLHIKLEVDTNPPSIKFGKREDLFITRFNEVFPIIKHNEGTLFAGKVLAVICRPYQLGRDYYDLVWYFRRKTKIEMAYLNDGLKRSGREPFKNFEEVLDELNKKVGAIKPSEILSDIHAFLEDASEEVWIKRYPEVFKQVSTLNT